MNYRSTHTKKDPTPVYFKLQLKLKEEIESGVWQPGSKIPPERHLAEIYQVSVGTVRKAVLNLVNEGFLRRDQGRGTFVTGTTLRRESLRYYRFLKDLGGKEANVTIKFLGIAEVACQEPLNRHLKIRRGQKLYEVERLFCIGPKPVIHTLSYLPQRMFPNLEDFPKSRFENITLYLALEESYGLPTIFNQELFGAYGADARVAQALGVPLGHPTLRIRMVAYTYKEKPYEYRIAHCLTQGQDIFRET